MHVFTNGPRFITTATLQIVSNFQKDQLLLNFSSPLLSGRYTTVILGGSGAGNWNCTLPGPFWQKEFDVCDETFMGSMPWSLVQQCGWTLDTSDPSYYTFSSNLVVHDYDPIPQFKLFKDTSFNIPLYVIFQKSVVVNSNLAVSSTLVLTADITKQTVDTMARIAQIEITTQVPAPYFISNQSINKNPATISDVTVTQTSNATTCSASASACVQSFLVKISTGIFCDISGFYGIAFTYQCLPGAAGCSLPGTTSSVLASVSADSFCPKLYANSLPDTSSTASGSAISGGPPTIVKTSPPSLTPGTSSSQDPMRTIYGWAAAVVGGVVFIVLVVTVLVVKKHEEIRKKCFPDSEEEQPSPEDNTLSSPDIPKVQPRTSVLFNKPAMEDF